MEKKRGRKVHVIVHPLPELRRLKFFFNAPQLVPSIINGIEPKPTVQRKFLFFVLPLCLEPIMHMLWQNLKEGGTTHSPSFHLQTTPPYPISIYHSPNYHLFILRELVLWHREIQRRRTFPRSA